MPGRVVNGAEAGAVDVRYGGGGVQQLTEATPGIPGTPPTADRFGLSLYNLSAAPASGSWLVIGAPPESIGSTAEAGLVVVVPRDGNALTGARAQAFNEGTGGVKGTVCDSCRFGWGLG